LFSIFWEFFTLSFTNLNFENFFHQIFSSKGQIVFIFCFSKSICKPEKASKRDTERVKRPSHEKDLSEGMAGRSVKTPSATFFDRPRPERVIADSRAAILISPYLNKITKEYFNGHTLSTAAQSTV